MKVWYRTVRSQTPRAPSLVARKQPFFPSPWDWRLSLRPWGCQSEGRGVKWRREASGWIKAFSESLRTGQGDTTACPGPLLPDLLPDLCYSGVFQLPSPAHTHHETLPSVQFSCSVMSDSLQPHVPQHARPPDLSPTSRVYPISCPLSWWCHPTISSSVVPFSSCSQSLPASRSFSMSQLFASCSQSIGVSALASVLPMNTQDWSPLGSWLDLLAVQGTFKSLLQHHSWKASVLQHSAFFIVQLSYQYMVTRKTIALMRWTFVDKVMSLLFNMLSRLVIAFLSRSKRRFFGEMELLRENGCRYWHSDHAESLWSKTQFASNPPEWSLAAWSFHSRPQASFCEKCQEERQIKTENKNLRRNKDS